MLQSDLYILIKHATASNDDNEPAKQTEPNRTKTDPKKTEIKEQFELSTDTHAVFYTGTDLSITVVTIDEEYQKLIDALYL